MSLARETHAGHAMGTCDVASLRNGGVLGVEWVPQRKALLALGLRHISQCTPFAVRAAALAPTWKWPGGVLLVVTRGHTQVHHLGHDVDIDSGTRWAP